MACAKSELIQVSEKLKLVNEKLHKLESEKVGLLARKKVLEEQLEVEADLNQSKAVNWESTTDFPWSEKVGDVLTGIFKIDSFRPLQVSAINAYLSGKDVLVIMPTGGGKSLCYQLPALVLGGGAKPSSTVGFTLVVSPLVSLMEDQVMSLTKLDIDASMLSASTSKTEVNRVLSAMVDAKSTLKLLYVTPEKLSKSKRFMAKLQKSYELGIFARLAIDEVHCCSVWGHDFRPDYKFLGVVRNLCPKVPIIGLTATSTPHVTDDVKKILRIKSCLVFRAPLNRPNLFYQVRPKPENQKGCLDALEKLLKVEFAGQSGIIYTLTIKDVESLTQDLKARGLRVGCYHANLEHNYRSAVHKKWLDGSYQAVIATIAFGMGIDKPDVRFVVHHCMSKSMENFYQESGRAGRDDLKATCVMYYRFADISRLSTMVFTEQTGLEKLYGMVSYCLNAKRCRRKIISDHFGEPWESTDCSQMCDKCGDTHNNFSEHVDVSPVAEACHKILTNAQHLLDTKLTALKLVDALFNKGPANLRLPDGNRQVLQVFSQRIQVEYVVAHLLIEGYLKEDFHFTPYNTISYMLPGSRPIMGPIVCSVPGSVKKRPQSQEREKKPKKAKKNTPVIYYVSDSE